MQEGALMELAPAPFLHIRTQADSQIIESGLQSQTYHLIPLFAVS